MDLSFALSLAALLVAAWTAWSNHRHGKEQRKQGRTQTQIQQRMLDLEESHKALEGPMLREQLMSFRAMEDAAKRANVRAHSVLGSGAKYSYLELTNEGSVVATRVTLTMSPLDDGEAILFDQELAQLPVDLQPGDTISLSGAAGMGSAFFYDALIAWTDPDGTARERKQRIEFRH